MVRRAASLAVLLLAAACLARAQAFPAAVTLPSLPLEGGGVQAQRYGEVEFVGREKVEVLRGKTWLGYLDYRRQWGDDKRNALAGIVHEMEKGGWEVMLRDEPRNPPLATLRRSEDGKELWARVEIFDQARVEVLEPGPAPGN